MAINQLVRDVCGCYRFDNEAKSFVYTAAPWKDENGVWNLRFSPEPLQHGEEVVFAAHTVDLEAVRKLLTRVDRVIMESDIRGYKRHDLVLGMIVGHPAPRYLPVEYPVAIRIHSQALSLPKRRFTSTGSLRYIGGIRHLRRLSLQNPARSGILRSER